MHNPQEIQIQENDDSPIPLSEWKAAEQPVTVIGKITGVTETDIEISKLGRGFITLLFPGELTDREYEKYQNISNDGKHRVFTLDSKLTNGFDIKPYMQTNQAGVSAADQKSPPSQRHGR